MSTDTGMTLSEAARLFRSIVPGQRLTKAQREQRAEAGRVMNAHRKHPTGGRHKRIQPPPETPAERESAATP